MSQPISPDLWPFPPAPIPDLYPAPSIDPGFYPEPANPTYDPGFYQPPPFENPDPGFFPTDP